MPGQKLGQKHRPRWFDPVNTRHNVIGHSQYTVFITSRYRALWHYSYGFSGKTQVKKLDLFWCEPQPQRKVKKRRGCNWVILTTDINLIFPYQCALKPILQGILTLFAPLAYLSISSKLVGSMTWHKSIRTIGMFLFNWSQNKNTINVKR